MDPRKKVLHGIMGEMDGMMGEKVAGRLKKKRGMGDGAPGAAPVPAPASTGDEFKNRLAQAMAKRRKG